MDIEHIKNKNNKITINDIYSYEFLKYGKIINGYDFSEFIGFVEKNTEIPDSGNIYHASCEYLEKLPEGKRLMEAVFGFMDVQIGYCNGRNSSLNGLEYHKCSEINIAVTDLVLLLGRVQDIKDYSYDSKSIEAFYIPRGTAVELYTNTLHFAPCRVNSEGFKCIVILIRGTNMHIEKKKCISKEDKLLFAANKWLLVHPDNQRLLEKGAYPGIKGINIEIKL